MLVTYRQLQARAKERGIRANQKRGVLERLLEVGGAARTSKRRGLGLFEGYTAAEAHDAFNLVAMPIFSALIAWYIVDGVSVADGGWDTSRLTEPENRLYWASAVLTIAYYVMDFVFIYTVPWCVRSPRTIMSHHVAALALLSVSIAMPKLRLGYAGNLVIELNSFLLIARRTQWVRLRWPARIVVGALFYASWFVIRLGVYPCIALWIYAQWAPHCYDMRGTADAWYVPYCESGVNIITAVLLAQLALVALNVKWTVELVSKALSGSRTISKGL